MNQNDNMRVILSSVFVTFHRIARSLKRFYKGSKLIWIFFFFLTLCMPIILQMSSRVKDHVKSHWASGSLNRLLKIETSCPSAFKKFSILSNPDTFHLCQFYFSHFQKKRKHLILDIFSVSCYFSWKNKVFSDLPVQHNLSGTIISFNN